MASIITTVDLAAGTPGDQRDIAFLGATLRETAGASAIVTVTSTATGKIKLTRSLTGNESVVDFFGPDGLKCAGGMTVVITGTVTGALFYR